MRTAASIALGVSILAVVSVGVPVSRSAPSAMAAPDAEATMTGEVFVDFDRDGRIDPGERQRIGATGVTVTVTDSVENISSGSTDTAGSFAIAVDATAAPYRIEFEVPDGYSASFSQSLTTTTPNGESDGATEPSVAATSVQFVDDPDAAVVFGIVPDSSCPDDPTGVGIETGRFSGASPNSVAGKIWTTCFVDGSAFSEGGAQDVLVGSAYDASGWSPEDGEEFGGSIDVEHIATKQQMGAVWGLAADEWDGWLVASAVVKRHSGLGPEGIDGLYWLDVNDTADGQAPDIASVSLDSLSPSDAPSFGADPPVCSADTDQFSTAETRRDGTWDCRDLDGVDGGGESHDWWAYDRTGRDGIGDIDTTPSGDTLFVMNATADAVFVYDIVDLAPETAPTYRTHITIDDPGCADGEFEAWGTTAIDEVSLLVGVTCTAATSGDVADLVSHVVQINVTDATQQSVLAVPHDYRHGAGYTEDPGPVAGRFQPWIGRVAPDGPLTYPDVTEAAGIRFLDFLDAYGYSNAWDWHQPLLSDIEVDPLDGSLVLGVADRWAMMTGVFNCDLDPIVGECGHEIPAPPPDDYDGVPGNEATAGYTAPIGVYTAGDLLRACKIAETGTATGADTAAQFVLEGSPQCAPSPDSPSFDDPFGGGPAGDTEWYWGDQAFGDDTLMSPHPETAQGAVFIGDRRDDTVFTAMNPSDTFGAGFGRISNRDGTRIDSFQLFRTDFEDSDGTGWKGASIGDIEGCTVPLEIGNAVWFDLDGDGLRDPDDPGLENVGVALVDLETDEEVATTATTADGSFFFGTADGLAPQSDYRLTFDLAAVVLDEGAGLPGGLRPDRLVPTELQVVDDASQIDSDARIDQRVTLPYIDVETGLPGDNDHSLDAGFVTGDPNEAINGSRSWRPFLIAGAVVLLLGVIGVLLLRREWRRED